MYFNKCCIGEGKVCILISVALEKEKYVFWIGFVEIAYLLLEICIFW